MAYTFPENLGVLRTWLAGRGVDLTVILTERQAAFRAQKSAETYFRFPPRGQSCSSILLDIQKAVINMSQARHTNLRQKLVPHPRVKARKSSRLPRREGHGL
jgi:hypothetical protein